MSIFYSGGKTLIRALAGGVGLLYKSKIVLNAELEERNATIRMPYARYDIAFVTGDNRNEVEIARFCGDSTKTDETNVSNCFTYKKPVITVGPSESTTAMLMIVFGSLPSNGNQLVITANSVTSTINFTNSGGTDATFSGNAADVDISAGNEDTTAKVATAVKVLYDSLANYSAAVDLLSDNKLRVYADVAYTSTYDITVGTNTSGATTTLTAGKHFTLLPADSGAILAISSHNATVLLPDSGTSGNIGCTYTFIWRSHGENASTVTTGQKILCADTTNERIFGTFTGVDTDSSNTLNVYTGSNWTSTPKYNSILWNGTTTGGNNSCVTLTAIAADQWVATNGIVYQTGTPTTPFLTS